MVLWSPPVEPDLAISNLAELGGIISTSPFPPGCSISPWGTESKHKPLSCLAGRLCLQSVTACQDKAKWIRWPLLLLMLVTVNKWCWPQFRQKQAGLKLTVRTDQMAHSINKPATKVDDFTWIPRNQKGEGKNQLLYAVPWLHDTCTVTYVCTHEQNNKKLWISQFTYQTSE